MRGAVSVALVYLYYDPDGTSDDVSKSSLISATLTVVLFSTLAYGAITKPMLDFLLGPEGAESCIAPCTHQFAALSRGGACAHCMKPPASIASGQLARDISRCRQLSSVSAYQMAMSATLAVQQLHKSIMVAGKIPCCIAT